MLKSTITIYSLAIIGSFTFAANTTKKLTPAKKTLTEAEQIEILNKANFKKIFARCSEIEPLVQFIDTYKPTSALEFFNPMQEVVQVVSVVEVKEKYKVSFIAPVSILKNDKYTLTGEPSFTIEDLTGGKFTKITPDGKGKSTGPSIQLDSTLWKLFIANNANIETLRVIKEKPKKMQNRVGGGF